MVQITFPEKSLITKVYKQPLDCRILGKSYIKHYKTTCWYEFDIQPSTTESAIEFNMTIDWQGLGAFLHSISKLHKNEIRTAVLHFLPVCIPITHIQHFKNVL